jgi:hypothetical protein
MSQGLAIVILTGSLIHFAPVIGAELQPGKIDDDALLALPWKQFDQTLGSGWRVYACRKDYAGAARLIETYLARRTDLTPAQRAVSNFHAAAELGHANRYEAALRHLESAEVPAGTRGVPEDWNELVMATRAFLLSDRKTLLASQRRVEMMASPAFPRSAAQYLEHLGERYGSWDEGPTPACDSATK